MYCDTVSVNCYN